MSEHKEVLIDSPERGLDNISDIAAERSKELLKNLEQDGGDKLSVTAERSKVEALFTKERPQNEKKQTRLDSAAPRRKALPKPAGKKERDASFRRTMSHVRDDLYPHERIFSRVIHNPAIEKISDTAGSTIARPNAILAGSFTAFAVVTATYVIAQNMGYMLSGFETIGAFTLGWVVGLIFDYVRIAIRGKAD